MSLVLTRKFGDYTYLKINGEIIIIKIEPGHSKREVRINFTAPKHVEISRLEWKPKKHEKAN